MANKPLVTIVAARKLDDGTYRRWTLATVWDNEGRANIKVERETTEDKYPKGDIVSFLEKGYGTKEGAKEGRYINVYMRDDVTWEGSSPSFID